MIGLTGVVVKVTVTSFALIDVQPDALKYLMQRLAAMHTEPALLEARQGEEEGEEPEEQLGAASSSTTWQSEQNWWQ